MKLVKIFTYSDFAIYSSSLEKSRKNVESTLAGFEKHAEEAKASLKKTETQLALAIEKTKQ